MLFSLTVHVSAPATATASLTTCIDLATLKERISKNGTCLTPQEALARWRIVPDDSALAIGRATKTLMTCSNRESSPFAYQLIRAKCAKHMQTNRYTRYASLPAKPVITRVIPLSHESASLSLATDSATSTDAPITYFTISTSKGDVKKIHSWRDLTLTISGLRSSTSYTFTVSATNADGTSPLSATSQPVTTQVFIAPQPDTVQVSNTPPAPSCANGGTCVVGDRGPGGGIVFFVSTPPFTSTGSSCNTACKYLEVAPATWQSAGTTVANDTTYQWSNNITDGTAQDSTAGSESGFDQEKFSWRIGQGFYNTSVMKVAGATSTAQAAVLAYAGNVTAGQWFIPSANELNELCKYARGQLTGNVRVACDSSGTLKTGTLNDLGGFVSSLYMSSSEWWNYGARSQYFNTDGFGGNRQRSGNKDLFIYVRPIRAF